MGLSRIITFSGCLFTLLFCHCAMARTMGILSPSHQSPTTVKPGDAVSIDVAIPFALTPPPGVQKVTVWKDWHVILERRADAALGVSSNLLRYEQRFLRIRPCEKNVNYVVSAEVLKWLPAGRYDLVLSGPGFSYRAEGAVVVNGKTDSCGVSIEVEEISNSKWRLQPATPILKSCSIDVVVGAKILGVRFLASGEIVSVSEVVWGASTMDSGGDGKRLVRLRWPSSMKSLSLVADAVPDAPGTVEIIVDRDEIRPMQWVQLRAKTQVEPLHVIWRMVDGDSAEGETVRYRWMVSTEAFAEVTVFDDHARVYRKRMVRPLTMPLSRKGTGCGCHIWVGTSKSLLNFLFNACFD